MLAADALAARRADVLSYAISFSDLHLRMYALLTDDTAKDWTLRYITTTDYTLPSQGLYSSFSVYNLLEVGTLFTAQLRALADPVLSPASYYRVFSDACAKGPPLLASMGTDFVRLGNAHEALAASLPIGFNASHCARSKIRAQCATLARNLINARP